MRDAGFGTRTRQGGCFSVAPAQTSTRPTHKGPVAEALRVLLLTWPWTMAAALEVGWGWGGDGGEAGVGMGRGWGGGEAGVRQG